MKSLRTLLLAITMCSFATPQVTAQQACPCVPLTKLWVAVSCDSWYCAASEVSIANGDGTVFAVPTGGTGHRWIVIKQVTAGAWVDDSPFKLDSFDPTQFTDAVVRFSRIDDDHQPRIVSAPDGRFLVISLREAVPRRRSVAH